MNQPVLSINSSTNPSTGKSIYMTISEEENVEEFVINKKFYEDLRKLIYIIIQKDNRFIKKDSYVTFVNLRYGLDGGEALSLADIAKKLNVTREMVRMFEKRFLNALRDNSKLKNYIGEENLIAYSKVLKMKEGENNE